MVIIMNIYRVILSFGYIYKANEVEILKINVYVSFDYFLFVFLLKKCMTSGKK